MGGNLQNRARASAFAAVFAALTTACAPSIELRMAVEVVSDYLAARGVPAGRLKAQRFGKEYPNDSNETPGGRANNRRTELILPQ